MAVAIGLVALAIFAFGVSGVGSLVGVNPLTLLRGTFHVGSAADYHAGDGPRVAAQRPVDPRSVLRVP